MIAIILIIGAAYFFALALAHKQMWASGKKPEGRLGVILTRSGRPIKGCQGGFALIGVKLPSRTTGSLLNLNPKLLK